jgi:hypothetical protein
VRRGAAPILRDPRELRGVDVRVLGGRSRYVRYHDRAHTTPTQPKATKLARQPHHWMSASASGAVSAPPRREPKNSTPLALPRSRAGKPLREAADRVRERARLAGAEQETDGQQRPVALRGAGEHGGTPTTTARLV